MSHGQGMDVLEAHEEDGEVQSLDERHGQPGDALIRMTGGEQQCAQSDADESGKLKLAETGQQIRAEENLLPIPRYQTEQQDQGDQTQTLSLTISR